MWGAILGGVASAVGNIFGGGSKKQETTSRVDYKRLVRDAEAAGFNPLTALRNGGSAGFSVTSTGAAPLSARIADGVSGGVQNFLANFDPHKDQQRELETRVVEAQLANLQADTALKTVKFGNVPSYTASPVKRVMGSGVKKSQTFSSVADVLPPSAGTSQTPDVEKPTVTNAFPSSWGASVNPNVPDASAWEDRYGDSEVLSMATGLGIGATDIYYNVAPPLYAAGKSASQVFRNEWSLRKQAYDAWKNGAPMPPPLSGKRSRLRAYQ